MCTFLKNCILYAVLLPAFSLFANIAYVGNGNNKTLTVIDTSTNSVEGTITLGAEPVLIAITPNNLYAYVTQNNDSISVIYTEFNSINGLITLPSGSHPVGIAITPNGQFAYVANQGNGTVSVIYLATNQIFQNITGFNAPWGIVITPDGKFAYVVNGGPTPGYVSVIDLSSNTVLPFTIQVDNGPTGIAITPDGKLVYVTNENSNTVSVISTATNTLIQTIPVGTNPFEVSANPNGKFVYDSNNAYTNPPDSSISVISTATNEVVATIPLYSSGPSESAVTSDGLTLYVTNTINIAVISTVTNQVLGTIPVSGTSSIAITATLISGLKGEQRINDFGLVYEYFNHLEWKPTPFSGVIGYNIYRDGVFIASLNSITFQYDDHDQKKNYPVEYSVVPIEANGQESTPLSVVVNKNRRF